MEDQLGGLVTITPLCAGPNSLSSSVTNDASWLNFDEQWRSVEDDSPLRLLLLLLCSAALRPSHLHRSDDESVCPSVRHSALSERFTAALLQPETFFSSSDAAMIRQHLLRRAVIVLMFLLGRHRGHLSVKPSQRCSDVYFKMIFKGTVHLKAKVQSSPWYKSQHSAEHLKELESKMSPYSLFQRVCRGPEITKGLCR